MKLDKNQLEELRFEYEKLEMNEEGVNIMKKNIEKAKKENQKNLKKGLAIAGVCAVTLVAIPNISPSVAIAMEKVPVIGPIVDFITFRDYSDKKSNINVEAPKAENQNLDMLNKTTDEYIKSLVDKFKAEFEKGDNKSLDINYDILRDDDNILSLQIKGLETGASGYMFSKIYNVDKKTGNILELKDIFKEGTDYVTILTENIKEQMKKQMEEDSNKVYFLDKDIPDGNFEKIKENQNFYFNANNELVICFDEYEVAPGSMGKVQFIIPQDITNNILK